MSDNDVIIVNGSSGKNLKHCANNRYVIFNNIALDGFLIGSGKTTTIDRICDSLITRLGWIDQGKLRGSNLRLLRKEVNSTKSHYCLVCDDVLAACSLPDKTSLATGKPNGNIFTRHNMDNFTAMGSPRVNDRMGDSYFVAKINAQNILNAAYGQLISCGINELVSTYSKDTFSTNPNEPTNVILLYSREINFAQIQFTLGGVLAEHGEMRLIIPHLLDEIRRTIIDKPFNFGHIRNRLLIYYDQCHSKYTTGLADRRDYAKLCYENILKRNREFEIEYYDSFEFFYSFFNFQREGNEIFVQQILSMIYNLGSAYEHCWSHEADYIPNALSFDQTVDVIVRKVTDEISLLTVKR